MPNNMDIPKKKSIIKRMFCKHNYKQYLYVGEFLILSGDHYYTVCEKCGKIKSKDFYEYNDEGTGYR